MKPLLAVSSPLACLCLSQITLPSPSTAPHMAMMMLWLRRSIPPLLTPGKPPHSPPWTPAMTTVVSAPWAHRCEQVMRTWLEQGPLYPRRGSPGLGSVTFPCLLHRTAAICSILLPETETQQQIDF